MRKLLLFVSVAAFTAFSNPARAQFCPGVSPWVFDDVLASDPFCGFITWMAENGITLGCQVIDANHRLYCPTANTSRSQMAAFMNRLGNIRVEAVDTGPGLLGGPITSTGTIALAPTQLLPTTPCTNNQVPRWNGSAWACGNDANSGGTVTSVASGTGLTGGPITTSGTLSIATGYQLPQGCGNNQVAKSNGAGGWTCANDANGGGTVTSITAGNGLTGGTITTSGTIAVDPTSSTLTTNFFRQGGNAFGATAVLGTADNNAIDVRVNGSRVMRYEPNAISPNVIGGSPANDVTAGVRGATIGGGGVPYGNTDPDFNSDAPNRVTDAYGTVGGGYANRAGDDAGSTIDRAFATVSGGAFNTASGFESTIGGGVLNLATGAGSAVGGGGGNVASGPLSVVGGGDTNTASGASSVVPGGKGNTASGFESTVAGGLSNTASGDYAAIAGGRLNVASGIGSLAAGTSAKTQTPGGAPTVHNGAFVWADNNLVDFNSEVANEFAARATGGVRFVTAIDPTGNQTRWVKINSNGELDFGAQTRQMLNLWGPSAYGIGVQGFTLYARSDSSFAWFAGGSHSDTTYEPGPGGSVLATLQTGPSATAVTGTFRAQVLTQSSDRAMKTDFSRTDGTEVLAKVVTLPIATWSYVNEQASGVRHIGPTAQDFRERFGVGYDDKTIATVDADGVALAAIQGLNAKLENAIAERDARIDRQEREIAELRRILAVMMSRIAPGGHVASR